MEVAYVHNYWYARSGRIMTRFLLAYALGAVLSSAGVHINNWQFWVVVIIYVFKERLLQL